MGEVVDVGQVRIGSFIWQWGVRFWKTAAGKGMWGEAGDDRQWKLCGRWDRAEEMQGGMLSTTKEPAGESTLGSHSKQHRVGLPGFMYVDVQKHAFSQHMVLGQHPIPKGGKAGFGWNPVEGRMPVTAN